MVGVERCVAGPSEGKGWDWRESCEIGKLFECHLEDFKPDGIGEFVLFYFLGSVFPRMTLTFHVLYLVIF